MASAYDWPTDLQLDVSDDAQRRRWGQKVSSRADMKKGNAIVGSNA